MESEDNEGVEGAEDGGEDIDDQYQQAREGGVVGVELAGVEGPLHLVLGVAAHLQQYLSSSSSCRHLKYCWEKLLILYQGVAVQLLSWELRSVEENERENTDVTANVGLKDCHLEEVGMIGDQEGVWVSQVETHGRLCLGKCLHEHLNVSLGTIVEEEYLHWNSL